ncbi:hypothetical protein ENBRE01_3140 [Enteropsectra breve]|nr:hypothetical protein ENBRE01_3108 [Enteropsectra breve]KAI5153177.1 hypothetical protein ENBRE01_3140 [Enteropsectra breve]
MKLPQQHLKEYKKIKVLCRNNKEYEGRLKKYDRHYNLIIIKDNNKELLIRGDGIITIQHLKC